MKTITAKYQNRTGVFAEHRHAKLRGTLGASVRMTIPAREAIERVAGMVEADGAYYFSEPPKGVIVVLAPAIELGAPTGTYMPAYRCTDEPPYPGERPNGDRWIQANLTPCPVCGAALVWYESGYVPGYRVCARKPHHHVIVG